MKKLLIVLAGAGVLIAGCTNISSYRSTVPVSGDQICIFPLQCSENSVSKILADTIGMELTKGGFYCGCEKTTKIRLSGNVYVKPIAGYSSAGSFYSGSGGVFSSGSMTLVIDSITIWVRNDQGQTLMTISYKYSQAESTVAIGEKIGKEIIKKLKE